MLDGALGPERSASPSADGGVVEARVSALTELGLMDTPREAEFDEIVELAAAICGVPIGYMALLDSRRQWFKASIGLDIAETAIEDSFCQWTIQQNELLLVEDTTKDARFEDHPLVTGEPNVRFYAGMPVQVGGQTNIGTLCVVDVVARKLTPMQLRALGILARQIQTQIEIRAERMKLRSALAANEELMARLEERNKELSEANKRLQELALTDPLTGLLNRRAFERMLDQEWRRSTRLDKAISVLMIDTDHFKNFNDSYGHLEGDVCLTRVAAAIKGVLQRPSDLVARFGGEEFVVLLPHTDRNGAGLVAERICAAVRDLGIEHRGSALGVVTVSIGYATLRSREELHPAMLTHVADLALYEAKRSGRNCARSVTEDEVLSSQELPHGLA